jgi:hypothetical protein
MKAKSRAMIKALATITAFFALNVAADSAEPFKLVNNDVVVFAGGTNAVRAGKAGHLETLLTRRLADAMPRFRDLSWEGDTVFQQATVADRWREEAFGGWPEQLERVEATVIFAQYGQVEALQGKAGLEEFVAAYQRWLTVFAKHTPRIALISPTPFEKSAPLLPDLSARNADLELYVEAIHEITRRRDLLFVDVSSVPVRTANGMHLLPESHTVVAVSIASKLGDTVTELNPSLGELHRAVVTKNTLWFDYWRPANWKCLFGDDSNRVFGRAAGDHPPFREEWATYPALVTKAEKSIWKLASEK